VTLKGQGHGPNTLNAKNLENNWRYYLATIAMRQYGSAILVTAWLLVSL